jgi:endonuclease/exonuclease/phosphatase family metal-dependent hydrolase
LIVSAACLVPARLPANPQNKSTLRVLCWNIHHGEGLDGKLDLPRIAAVILAAKPDVVALQEVDQTTSRTGKVDQTAELARLTGMKGVFGKAMDFGGGGYGQAILSKHPIQENQVHRLPGKGEPRIAFEAGIELGGKLIRIVSTHLDLNPAQRLEQAKVLSGLFQKITTPVILCGDFNDSPDSASLQEFRTWKPIPKLGDRATHPADKPTDEIDYFFTQNIDSIGRLNVLSESIASDHRPLLCEFDLP